MRKRWVAFLGWACALLASPAIAQEPAPFYAGGGLLYEFPDSARDSDSGWGGHLSFGLPLANRPGEGIELSLSALERDRDTGGSDKQYGIFADYVKAFGLYGWDAEQGLESWLPSFRPFVVAGLGAVQDEGPGGSQWAPGLDLGFGLLFPVSDRGIVLRTEARVQGQFNDQSVAGEDRLVDYQLRVGLRVPFGGHYRSADLPPPEECGVAVVDPVTGRTDCTVDSDRDGVADPADLCPGTPPGTPVDLNGCASAYPGDDDRDGVDNAADACPGTPEGMPVDEKGCERRPQPEPAPGLPEAGAGSLPQEPAATVMLSSVRFDKASAELTAAARSELDRAAFGLSSQQELVVELAGHTDDQGSEDYNLMLSLLRAERVRQYLVAKGISRYRLFVEGYGEARPMAPNDTPEGRALNRRVDVDPLDVEIRPK